MSPSSLIILTPIVISTLHGYLAARMTLLLLFHPRREIILFGRRLRYTPGLIPKQRRAFIDGFAMVIVDRLLDIEAIADEIASLNLEAEIGEIAHREYLHPTKSEPTIRIIVEHIRERLYHLRDSIETRWEIARSLRPIIEAEFERRLGFLRRTVAGYFLDDELIYRLVGSSIERLAESIAESLYVRNTIEQAMSQLPRAIFQQSGATGQSAAIRSLLQTLRERIDLREMIIHRLDTLSAEEIERIIREKSAPEISALVRLGTCVGLGIGLLQAAFNFFFI